MGGGLRDAPIDRVSKLFVHVDGEEIGHAHEEVNEVAVVLLVADLLELVHQVLGWEGRREEGEGGEAVTTRCHKRCARWCTDRRCSQPYAPSGGSIRLSPRSLLLSSPPTMIRRPLPAASPECWRRGAKGDSEGGSTEADAPELGSDGESSDVAVPVCPFPLRLAHDVAHEAPARGLSCLKVLGPLHEVLQVKGQIVLQQAAIQTRG